MTNPYRRPVLGRELLKAHDGQDRNEARWRRHLAAQAARV